MKLKITQWKNVDGLEFEIHDNLLVLVGKNAVGKSNVLEAIDKNKFLLTDDAGSQINSEYDDIFLLSSEIKMDDEFKTSADTSTFMKLLKELYPGNLDAINTAIEGKVSDLNNLLATDFSRITRQRDSRLTVKPVVASTFKNLIQPNLEIDGAAFGLEGGSGIKRMLIFMMINKLKIRDRTKKYIIMIDEPELHMHASLLLEFTSLLKEFLVDYLVIVTTHSVEVVKNLTNNISNIAKLECVNNQVRNIQIRTDDYKDEVLRFYSLVPDLVPNNNNDFAMLRGLIDSNQIELFCARVLRDDVLKVLFLDYVIIGEGPSEEILFDYMFRKLDDGRLREFNVDYLTFIGKYLSPFVFILANLFNVKSLCILDEDNLSTPIHLSYKNAFEAYSQANPLFQYLPVVPDLETAMGIRGTQRGPGKPLNIFINTYANTSTNSYVNTLYEDVIARLSNF